MTAILRWLPLLGLLLVSSCHAAAWSMKRETIVVLSDLDNPPFAGVDEQGRPIGRDVEMMEQLGSIIGKEIVWRRIPFDELFLYLETGYGDVICATLGVTKRRLQRARFTSPYFETDLAVVVRAGEDSPRSLGELDGLRVTASPGTTSELAVRERLSNSDWLFENEEGLGAAERLVLGVVDAAVMDGPAADALVAASGGLLARLREPLAAELYCLATPREKASFMGRLNGALASMRGTGAMQALNERYGLAEATISGE